MILALFTCGILDETYGHPQVQDFFDRIGEVFESAEESGGFIDHAGGSADPRWGPGAIPALAAGKEDRAVQTLSIWEDLEAVGAFAYQGKHSEALHRRRDWFSERASCSDHAAWWIPRDRYPTWEEAVERHQYLTDHGPTAQVFTLRSPFDRNGDPATFEPAKINAYHKKSRK